MLDLLMLLAAMALGVYFFRVKGEGFAVQFPTKENEKGIRTRTNAYIVLAIIVGTLIFARLNSTRSSSSAFALIVLSALILVITTFKKKS